MDYFTINKLNKCLPQSPPAANSKSAVLDSFLSAYNNPAFGWRAAKLLKDAPRFPLWPEGKLRWVYLAWMMMREPGWESDERFAPIVMAREINSVEERLPDKESLQAALIAPGSTVEGLVKKGVGMGKADVIEAYDALFFNVLDRREDAQFLRNLIYPSGRLDETVPGYADNLNFGKTLLRLGFNYGLEDVLYSAGYPTANLAAVSAAQASNLFQQQVMQTAYLLATNGFLNHARAHTTLQQARQLVQADKISGQDNSGEASAGVFGDIASSVLERDAISMEKAAHVLAMRED